MESYKQLLAFLLVCMLSISSLISPILACHTCTPGKVKPGPSTPVVHPPVVVPPITVPPIIVHPPVVVPPVVVPPVVGPPLLPPVGPLIPPVLPLPPGVVGPLLPPVGPVIPPSLPVPPVAGPPTVSAPPAGRKKSAGCPPPPAAPLTCPVDHLKLGGCVDLLGGLVKVKVGDPAASHCCPVLAGLVELEAAVCLCTTLKLKLLNMDVYVPLVLELLAVCGKTPPPGYTCQL